MPTVPLNQPAKTSRTVTQSDLVVHILLSILDCFFLTRIGLAPSVSSLLSHIFVLCTSPSEAAWPNLYSLVGSKRRNKAKLLPVQPARALPCALCLAARSPLRALTTRRAVPDQSSPSSAPLRIARTLLLLAVLVVLLRLLVLRLVVLRLRLVVRSSAAPGLARRERPAL